MASDASEENFRRLYHLLLRIAPRAVRKYFDTEFHPDLLLQVLFKNKRKLHELRDSRIISSRQWLLLFPKEKGKYL